MYQVSLQVAVPPCPWFSSVSAAPHTPSPMHSDQLLFICRCCEPPCCCPGDAAWRNPYETFRFLSANHSPRDCHHHHHLHGPLCPSLLHGMLHPHYSGGLSPQVMGMRGEKIPFTEVRAWIQLPSIFLSASSAPFYTFRV